MKLSNLSLSIVLATGTAFGFAASQTTAALLDHAAAGTSFDAYDNDDEVNVWNIGNLGTYQADVASSGSSTNQTFSASASVDGRTNFGVLKAQSSIQDFQANDGGELYGRGAAIWQDTLYVDDTWVNYNDYITMVLGVEGSMSADSDNAQPTNATIYVGVGNPGFSGIAGSFPGPAVIADAWAQDESYLPQDQRWDGDFLLPWADSPQEAGWETYTSTVSHNSEADSFTGSFEGTVAALVTQDGYDSSNDQYMYEFKIYLEADGITDEGFVNANAGSSLDILGFRTADGTMIPVENIAFESGMQIIPEPVSAALLGLGGLALIRRRR